MGSTGMQRLREKHASKKTNTVRLNAILDELDREEGTQSQPKTVLDKTPEKPKKAKISRFSKDVALTELEQFFFNQIWEKLEKIHDDPEPYRLSATNLAKVYALGKRLEERMEQDGGPILEDDKGRVYTHPAVKALQANSAQILLHLKALGMSVQGQRGPKKNEDYTFTSEFAQFS